MKFCSRCHTEKHESEFQVRRASHDGLTAACKECLSIYDKSRANQPKRIAARNAYFVTPEGRKSHELSIRKFITNNPLKRKAHCHISNALRDGKVIKPPRCQLCNVQCRPEAHHCDYSKPLEIMWLCKKCHVAWHKRNTPLHGDTEYQIQQMKISERNNTTSFDQ